LITRTIPRTAIPIDSDELKSIFIKASFEDSMSLERNLKAYLGAKAVIALDSGRSALALALRLLKLRIGDRVLLPAFVCPVLYDVVASAGFKPFPVDVSYENYNIDVSSIKETNNSKAIIPVHLFGKSYNLTEIKKFADYNGLAVIEDAAQALGLESDHKKIGSFGDLAILSFGLGKIITGGGGGALVINRDDLVQPAFDAINEISTVSSSRIKIAANIAAMRFFEKPGFYSIIRSYVNGNLDKTDLKMAEHVDIAWKSPDAARYVPHKIAPLAAKIADYQLTKLHDFNERRIHNAKVLSEILAYKSEDQVFSQSYFKNNVFCRFPIKLGRNNAKKRDIIIRKLLKYGVDSEKPYFVLRKLPQIIESMPNSSALVDTLITVPNHPCISENEIVSIGETTLSVLKSEL